MSSAAFWYGVFGTIFFEHLFYVWVAATVALLASLFVPRIETPPIKLPWRGRFVLALPTVWLVLSAFIDIEAYRPDSPGSWALWVVAVASAFLTLPYLLYVIIVAVVPDINRLKNTKLRVALCGIVLVTAIAGFVIGKNHPLFLQAIVQTYAIRIPKNQILQESVAYLLTRPVARANVWSG